MDVYCIDTSSYVYCQKSFGERLSRLVLYQAVWELLDSLAANGRLTGPHQV
ncbi:MAG: hypothetical protein QOJ81_1135, partial [Chloroflexota bacterium]|nr:hypothetical protein [Chloroflexota bacterium]